MSAKDAGLRIRVEKALREEFLDVCQSQHRPAAQVLREFMRGYVERFGDRKDKKASETGHPSRGRERQHRGS